MGQRRAAAGSGQPTIRRRAAATVGFVLLAATAAACQDGGSATAGGPEPSALEEPTAVTTPPPASHRSAAPSPAHRHRAGSPTPDGQPTKPPKHRHGDQEPPVSGPYLPRFGVVYHGMWDLTWAERAELLDKLVATGATWVRIGIPWATVQPNRPTADDPGWGMGWGVPKADRVIDQAVQRGLQVSATLSQTPGWADDGLGPGYLPSDPATYARALGWLAHRYRDKVTSWEIYNEPNNSNQLVTTVPEYVRLLCAAYPAAHTGDPTTTVLFGGTSGVDSEFIDAAYDRGAKGCFDVLAVHPYNGEYSPRIDAPSTARWWWRNIELVRDVMRRHHDLGTRVWFTEYGWSSHPNTPDLASWERGVSYREQARYAVQLLRITHRAYPYVERAAWYSARNETNSNLENNNFGLFTHDLRPKPVALRLRDFLATR